MNEQHKSLMNIFHYNLLKRGRIIIRIVSRIKCTHLLVLLQIQCLEYFIKSAYSSRFVNNILYACQDCTIYVS